jgi:hypothetical protein
MPERSITVTVCPASASSAAVAMPTMPPPTMMILTRGTLMRLQRRRARRPFGQHLTVAHAEADAVFLGAAVVAVGAGRAFLVERRGLLLWRHRVAAGTAENLVTFAKTVGDGDALVEDKA